MENENPNADITDEIVATTLDTYATPMVIDQLELGIPLSNRLMQSPHSKSTDGGHRIRVPVRTKKTDGMQSFGMGDTITPVRKPVITHAWATMKQNLSYVRFDWVEERMNAGSGKIVDLVTERVGATLQDAKEDFNTMLWADGTGNSAKDYMGLTGLLPATPATGVIMGYDRATNYWWRPWFWEGSTYGPHPIDADPAGGTTPTSVGSFGIYSGGVGGTGQGVATSFKIFETGYNSVMRGESPGDCFWISDQAVYEYYSVGYPLYQHNTELPLNEDIASFGFGGVMFKNVPWLYDTTDNGAPSGELRLVNTKYLYLHRDSGAWMVWQPWQSPFNQLARARFLVVRGNLVITNGRKHIVFTGITAWAAGVAA